MRIATKIMLMSFSLCMTSACSALDIGQRMSQVSPLPESIGTFTASLLCVSRPSALSRGVFERPNSPSVGSHHGRDSCPSYRPPQESIVHIYDFLPTRVDEEAFYDRPSPASGLQTYLILPKREERARNEAFLAAFVNIIHSVSAYSPNDEPVYISENRLNMFLVPVASHEKFLVEHMVFTLDRPGSNWADLLLTSKHGYSFDWARLALKSFCDSYTDLESAAPCVVPNASGPMLIVTSANKTHIPQRRIVLIDFSYYQNFEVFEESIREVLLISENLVKDPRTRYESYMAGTFSGNALDKFLTASKIADEIIDVLPKNWHVAFQR